MKKGLSVFLGIIIMFSFTACGATKTVVPQAEPNNQKDSNTVDTEKTNIQPEQQPYVNPNSK